LSYTDEVDNQELIPWQSMAWSAPRYSRRQVDAAGELLVRPRSIFDPADVAAFYGEAGRVLSVVNNWRAAHNWPLYAIRKTLENRAKHISLLEAKLHREHFRHLFLNRLAKSGRSCSV
jgi:hypothetical protein